MNELVQVNWSDLKVFSNAEFGKLRIVVIDGNPYAVAVDVARALGYKNTSDAINKHCRWVVKHDIPHPQSKDGNKTITVNCIPEGDIYRLITHSELPQAQQFEGWIFDEVLPSIRKHGAYMTSQTIDKIINDPDFGIMLLTTLKKEREEKKALMLENAKKDKLIEEYEPKAKYVEQILQSTDTVTITQIAKDYGMSGQALNQILHEEKVQYKQNGQWLLYAKFQDRGYTKSQTVDIVHSDGSRTVKMNTRWTQKGRLFIHELLEKRGIVAVVDRKNAEFAK